MENKREAGCGGAITCLSLIFGLKCWGRACLKVVRRGSDLLVFILGSDPRASGKHLGRHWGQTLMVMGSWGQTLNFSGNLFKARAFRYDRSSKQEVVLKGAQMWRISDRKEIFREGCLIQGK